jgi:precorrin-2 dehydrogenase/sirohydrochlorin ferrochelatase
LPLFDIYLFSNYLNFCHNNYIGRIFYERAVNMIIDLNLKGKQVLIVGGGVESSRKVEALLSQQCKITVVAEKVEKIIKDYAEKGKISLELRKIHNVNTINKFKSVDLILATTDDRKLNREIVLFGKSHRCYVYAADDPQVSDFSHPSVINIDDTVQVAISTGGRSPLMGKALREKVEPIIKKAVSELIVHQIKLQEQLRIKIQMYIPSTEYRKNFLIEIINNEKINKYLEENNNAMATTLAEDHLKEYLLRNSAIW